jgi:hypothetical protein
VLAVLPVIQEVILFSLPLPQLVVDWVLLIVVGL